MKNVHYTGSSRIRQIFYSFTLDTPMYGVVPIEHGEIDLAMKPNYWWLIYECLSVCRIDIAEAQSACRTEK